MHLCPDIKKQLLRIEIVVFGNYNEKKNRPAFLNEGSIFSMLGCRQFSVKAYNIFNQMKS